MRKTKWITRMITGCGGCSAAILGNIARASATQTGGELGGSKLVTGTTALFNDTTNILLGASALITTVLVIVHLIMLQNAAEQEIPSVKKKLKTIVISGVAVFLVSGLLKIIIGYYQ